MEKIILGLGNNIDYEIIWDSSILESLIEQYEISDCELSTDIMIVDERDLVVSILAFLKTGMGGERFVMDSSMLELFAKRFEYSITLGGTSVRSAIAMRKIGYTSALHLVTMNDDVRRLLPKGCSYVCSAPKEACYPHLIVQFYKGLSVQARDISIVADRSNRIIYDHDVDNIEMLLSEKFPALITEGQVFLISGFNAMQSEEKLNDRIVKLRSMMKSLPENAIVFYEDACYHRPGFHKIVVEQLLDFIDVFSLNEDELQGYASESFDLLDSVSMEKTLIQVKQAIAKPILILHTQYYALAYGENAYEYMNSLEAGILMAGTRFRHGDTFTLDQYNEMKQTKRQQVGIAMAQELQETLGEMVCCIPSLEIDETNATTIGLGDSFVGGFLPELCRLVK